LKNILSFKPLIKDYDFFLFDQWGVLHNGHKKFPQAENCLKILKDKNKKVVLISNSSMPTSYSINNLKKIGISENLYDYCITSGQIALNSIKKDIYSKYGINCFPLKLSKNKIKIFNLKCTKNIQKANFAMIADLDAGLTILDFAKNLDLMLKHNIPLLCSNPDFLVDDNNQLSMCGGTVAKLYEDMGGKVYRYGKPFKPIYININKKMKIIDPSKVLVIGDSLWHDVAGGNEMGFDCLWIKNGIHKSYLNKKKEIQPLLDVYKPKYLIKDLKL